MLFSLLFLTKTEQPSNCPPFEQSALYLPVSFSFGSKIVESLASDGVLTQKVVVSVLLLTQFSLKK